MGGIIGQHLMCIRAVPAAAAVVAGVLVVAGVEVACLLF